MKDPAYLTAAGLSIFNYLPATDIIVDSEI